MGANLTLQGAAGCELQECLASLWKSVSHRMHIQVLHSQYGMGRRGESKSPVVLSTLTILCWAAQWTRVGHTCSSVCGLLSFEVRFFFNSLTVLERGQHLL